MSKANIVTGLLKKTNTGSFDSMFLGPEQRYVGPLRGTTINNLEEQLTLGPDRIITTWSDDIAEYEKIEFTPQEDVDATGSSFSGNTLVLDTGSFCFVDADGNITDAAHAEGIQSICEDLDFAFFQGSGLYLLDAVSGSHIAHYILTKINYFHEMSPEDFTNTARFNGNQIIFGPNTVEFDPTQPILRQVTSNNNFMNFVGNGIEITPLLFKGREILQWKREDGNIINVAEKAITVEKAAGNSSKIRESIINYLA